jgi:AraC-like DNA-binding protein
MLAAKVQDYTDVDQLQSVIAVRDFFVARGGSFHLRLVEASLHRLWLRCTTETLPRSALIELDDQVGVGFSASNNPAMKHQGMELVANEVSMLAPGGALWHATTGPGSWYTMILPANDFVQLGTTLAGRDIMPSTPSLTAKVAPASLARLQALYASAARVAESAPGVITNSDAAHGLEASLSQAMIECVACGDMRLDTASRRRNVTILKRLGQLEEASRGCPLYLADVCKALRVSQRTLHQICQEYLGVGPKRYLLLRRMRLAHRELETASRGETTVTEVAMKYGFWELGRFAGAYRQTFGESPSVTLAR